MARSCDVCFAWPGTKKRGDFRVCTECDRKYEVRSRSGVQEVVPR